MATYCVRGEIQSRRKTKLKHDQFWVLQGLLWTVFLVSADGAISSLLIQLRIGCILDLQTSCLWACCCCYGLTNVSLCSPEGPRTCYVNQANLKFTENLLALHPSAPASASSAGAKHVHHHAWLEPAFEFFFCPVTTKWSWLNSVSSSVQ